MIQGLDVVVSFRSTQNTSGRYGRNGMYVPMILIGYDSRKDKFNKVKRYFNYIRPVVLHQKVYVLSDYERN